MIWHDLEIAYIAALLEGEGCFCIRKDTKLPRVAIAMTDEDTICKLPEILGIGKVSGPYDKGGNRKPVWEWHVNDRRDMARLLAAIYPLMSNRRQQKISELVDILHDFSRPLQCAGCEEIIMGPERSRRDKQYCSRKCNMKHYEKTRRGLAGQLKAIDICKVCNGPFTEDGRQRYCSKRCFMDAKNHRRRVAIN